MFPGRDVRETTEGCSMTTTRGLPTTNFIEICSTFNEGKQHVYWLPRLRNPRRIKGSSGATASEAAEAAEAQAAAAEVPHEC